MSGTNTGAVNTIEKCVLLLLCPDWLMAELVEMEHAQYIQG